MKAAKFRRSLEVLKGDFAANNYSFAEFIRFRNAHIGHSLIPYKPISNDLMAHQLNQNAKSLLRVVAAIEAQLKRNGISFGPPAMEKRIDWKRRSASFWRRAARPVISG